MIELIAECATNHGGSMALAKEFIARFAEAGADWVKFQHTRVRHLRRDDPQYDWFTRAELSVEQFAELKAYCEQCGTKFLTTVYNHQDVPEVVSLGLSTVKVGSGEASDRELLDALCWGRHLEIRRVIVGCGLTGCRYVHKADLLRCVTRYPAPAALALSEYGEGFVGWSDHCIGLEGCQIAICRGARIIEKHVQLPNQARPCKPWEATVDEFTALRQFADEDPMAKFVGRWQWQ